mmetsp:Transcript_107640/g.286497  ORF Transcript_107640/g.286497 Transcript_107640/m.286497 type:complete len:381 (+) Transcript_107640:142-1284(+)
MVRALAHRKHALKLVELTGSRCFRPQQSQRLAGGCEGPPLHVRYPVHCVHDRGVQPLDCTQLEHGPLRLQAVQRQGVDDLGGSPGHTVLIVVERAVDVLRVPGRARVQQLRRVLLQRLEGGVHAPLRNHHAAERGVGVDEHPQRLQAQGLDLRVVPLSLHGVCQQLHKAHLCQDSAISLVGANALCGLEDLLSDSVAFRMVSEGSVEVPQTVQADKLLVIQIGVEGRKGTPAGELRASVPEVLPALATRVKYHLDGPRLPHALAILRSVILVAAKIVGNVMLWVVEVPLPEVHCQLDDPEVGGIEGGLSIVEVERRDTIEALMFNLRVAVEVLDSCDRPVDGTHPHERRLALGVIPTKVGQHVATADLGLLVLRLIPHPD